MFVLPAHIWEPSHRPQWALRGKWIHCAGLDYRPRRQAIHDFHSCISHSCISKVVDGGPPGGRREQTQPALRRACDPARRGPTAGRHDGTTTSERHGPSRLVSCIYAKPLGVDTAP